MKKIIISFLCLVAIVLVSAFMPKKDQTNDPEVQWLTWEQAVELNKQNPKKIFIDVYTDWCGWCKVMDKNTFTDPKVAEYMQQNFYCVKLNAEQKADILFDGQTFSYMDGQGGRGVHTLAYSLLDGRMGFPTVVYLNEKYERIMLSPGYKKPEQIFPELQFAAQEAYKTQSFEDFKQTFKE